MRLLRTHGSKPKYCHKVLGGNFRLDALQAAILLVKLNHLARWNEARRHHAATYETLFQQHGLLERVTLPVSREGDACIYHQYAIRALRRDDLRTYLTERGISNEIYYPRPLHLQECYKELGYKAGDFPESERAARETLTLPIYPELQPAQQGYVVETIKAYLRE